MILYTFSPSQYVFSELLVFLELYEIFFCTFYVRYCILRVIFSSLYLYSLAQNVFLLFPLLCD